MTIFNQTTIEKRISEFIDPYLKKDLISAKALQTLELQENVLQLKFHLPYPCEKYREEFISNLTKFLLPCVGSLEIEIDLTWDVAAHAGARGIKGLNNIKNIIAIASGKGGVGKSTTAVNLALALSQEGARVGILDADIYGPSQPLMLGATQPKEHREQKILKPIMSHGIQSMSIGYLVDENSAMIWRGPMVTTALQQLLNETEWDNLDFLIIDLPPGTGDIQLTMAQKIPVSGAVIVTTPQDLALLDARRAYQMFHKVNIPVLGLVENMSAHVCSSCGFVENIFGADGGLRLADQCGIELLSALPLDINIRQHIDAGTPTVVADPESPNAKIYRELARHVAAKLALQTKDYSHKFPKVVVEN